MDQQITARQSIFDRPGDTRLYRVWVGVSTVSMRWDQMNMLQRAMQIQKERREANEKKGNPDSIA